ncbi:hypothetical protein PsorP6_017264 [Peronosclerospora sorghi]|uniref:Uncharacterized protein n=1 Tax=Peronosclerospora sorghi TaxID=230839 RepID=A0ACC0WLW3_9STRA|nr:hypothetical protein PsorP6_017264 [Peronosclerospora sorghi]
MSDHELAAARLNLCLGAERQLLARNAPQRRVPVTIVTGFLGAGKTSLLRHILQHKLNLRVACAVSDVAEINVDALLVANSLAGDRNLLFALQANPRTNSKGLRDVVWHVLNDEEDAASLGHVDYLVMETSGTTDPSHLVAAVDEKFGKMTRARLDSVVVLVDGDAVARDAAKGVPPCAVAIRQLQCADVVLLNKVDLLHEATLALARQVVTQHAPCARVYETKYAQVYLPLVLDLAPPNDAFKGGVSHESVRGQWSTGLSALTGNPRRSRVRVDRRSERMEATDEASLLPAFESVAFERTLPIPLAAVHNWIQHHVPDGTLRAKGVLYIAELPRHRFILQLSGKRRLEVDCTGVWQSTPKSQVVVIGACHSVHREEAKFDKSQALSNLERHFSRSMELLEDDTSTRGRSLALLEADERFDVVPSLAPVTVVAFRLTCPMTALTESMLRHRHSVDMNEVMQQFVRDVNASGKGSVLLYVAKINPNESEQEELGSVVASILGPASIVSMWDELDARADVMLHDVKKQLTSCRCGF